MNTTNGKAKTRTYFKVVTPGLFSDIIRMEHLPDRPCMESVEDAMETIKHWGTLDKPDADPRHVRSWKIRGEQCRIIKVIETTEDMTDEAAIKALFQ